MSNERRRGVVSGAVLDNDTIVNVARLLQEPVGALRDYQIVLDWFALDHDLMARDITGHVRLLRTIDGILVAGKAQGQALLECVRCLEPFDQPFDVAIEQLYRPTIDVRGGEPIVYDDAADAEETLSIDAAHELDLSEALRQAILVELPMRPICGDDCPGWDEDDEPAGESGDRRLAALAALLDDDDVSE
jgi:uncharacterized protein